MCESSVIEPPAPLHHRNPLAFWRAANLLHPRQFHAQHLPLQEQQCVELLTPTEN
jgi:hypothetical protein